ncbi:hypothetical protein [Methylobacterium sp. Gmos1]
MSDLPTRLRAIADLYDHRTAGLMRDAADEIESLRAVPLAALDTETIVSVAQVQALADAMWQVLDDMGADSRSVCLATKARARVAYQAFRFVNDDGDDGLDMPLSEAEAILTEIDAPASSPIVKTETS